MATSVKKSGKTWNAGKARLTLIIAGAVVFLLFAFIIVLGFVAKSGDTVLPHVSVKGIDVSGMTIDEVNDALEKGGFEIKDTRKLDITITDKVSMTVTGNDVGYIVTREAAAQQAVDYGRTGGFFGNAFTLLKCMVSSTDLDPAKTVSYDKDLAKEFVDAAVKKINAEKLDAFYKVTADTLKVTKGVTGILVDTDEIYTIVENAFKNEDYTPVEYKAETTKSKDIDFQAIYDTIFVAPVNAVYDPATQAASADTIGISFDVTAAKKLYAAAEEGKAIDIPLILTEPEITTEKLNEVLFADELSSADTSLANIPNRTTNVTLAANAINGTVLNPGDTFSFNDIVGERTAAKGYKEAAIYVAGETVDGLGGGICQVASTLYYCTLYANLEVVARDNHMFSVSYLPLGLDATVSWGSLDYQFKNNTAYPIKISCYVSGGYLSVSFYGTKTDDTYVEMYTTTVTTMPFDTIEKEDATIAVGTTKVKTTGYTGYVVDVYKYVYAGDGTVLESTYIGRDTYDKRDKVILIPVTVTPAPAPIPTPTPTPTPAP